MLNSAIACFALERGLLFASAEDQCPTTNWNCGEELHISGAVSVAGAHTTTNPGYPCSQALRTKADSKMGGPTRSAYTATRETHEYSREELEYGFGPDIGFTIMDKDGKDFEMGVIGMVIGDENDINDGHIVFKTWGADGDDSKPGAWGEEWATKDANGGYTRMTIHDEGVEIPDGHLQVTTPGYPVAHALRTKADSKMGGPTRSAYTATRETHEYSREELDHGFGPDIGFTVTDKDGKDMEMGVIGMVIGDENDINDGHIVFKTWGADGDNSNPDAWGEEWATKDANGGYTRMTVHDGGVEVPGTITAGDVVVDGQTFTNLVQQVADLKSQVEDLTRRLRA
jgi:hypothetical protein